LSDTSPSVKPTAQGGTPSIEGNNIENVVPSFPSTAVRRSSRSSTGLNRGKSPSISAAALEKTQKVLPRGLRDQIQGGNILSGESNVDEIRPAARLHKVSSDNKWMKPRKAVEHNDMRSILEKKFGEIRKFLGNEEEVEDSTFDLGIPDDFSFQNI
jgi:hypothetical protein